MKVLHLCSGDLNSGAGLGAYNQHKGLLDLGVDSKICGRWEGNEIPPDVIDITSTAEFARLVVNRLMNEFPIKIGNGKKLFNPGRCVDFIFPMEEIVEADVVNVHWALGGLRLSHLLLLHRMGKKIVWTMRDMWPYTGGCHYSMGCSNYLHGCGNCPMLRYSKEVDFSSYEFQNKKSLYKALGDEASYVAISKYQRLQASNSKMFSENRLFNINNSIDVSDFEDPGTCSRELKLKYYIHTIKPIISFGAAHLNAPYKGISHIIEFAKKFSNEYHFVAFGNVKHFDRIRFEDIGIQCLGYIDNSMVRDVYRLSDVFLMLSTQEMFGKTVIESIASGTPVVCFNDSGGPAEIVNSIGGDAGKSIGSTAELSEAVDECIRMDCTNVDIDAYSNRSTASKYISLYEEISN